MLSRPKIGLALGGGAARGFAHIGVIKVLEREGIPIDLIAGTSIGALVGAGYGLLKKATLLEERLKNFIRSKEFVESRYEFFKEDRNGEYGIFKNLEMLIKKGIFLGYAVARCSFISPSEYEKSIDLLLGDVTIEELGIPLACVTLDIRTGKEVIITKGSLKEAVWASSAIPGFLPPRKIKDWILVDGGWIDKVPVLPAFLLGADVVVAVDISSEFEDTKECSRGYEIMIRARAASDAILRMIQASYSDLLIRPNVGHLHWADFSKAEWLIQEGEKACQEKLFHLHRMKRRGFLIKILARKNKKKWIMSYLNNLIKAGALIQF